MLPPHSQKQQRADDGRPQQWPQQQRPEDGTSQSQRLNAHVEEEQQERDHSPCEFVLSSKYSPH